MIEKLDGMQVPFMLASVRAIIEYKYGQLHK